MSDQKFQEVLKSEEFKRLAKKRWTVSLLLTFVMLLVYFGFLLLVAYDKELLQTKVGEYTTIAIPLGIGLIIFAWIMTGIYISWANKVYDTEVEELKKKL